MIDCLPGACASQSDAMGAEQLVPGVIGAFVGVVGWLAVGLYIQRTQFHRQSKNAARAVYFELEMNRLNVLVALEYNMFMPLGRASFDRLLPELATWLRPADLQLMVAAYVAHTGYEQIRSGADFPAEPRKRALSAILDAQQKALAVLKTNVFSKREQRALTPAEPAMTE